MATKDTEDVTRPRRARIEDVAIAAEVSVATVSRALRGLPNVATSTRRRVEEAAEALDYRADPAASRLAAGRTRTVIVLVPQLASWYFSTIVAGAEAVCAEAGYDFMVVGVGSSEECRRLLDERHRLERRTDGVITVNLPVSDEDAASLRARGVALATVGTSVPGAPSVYVDDAAVGRLAADTLLDLGHRRIGLVSGRGNDRLDFEVPKLRHRGFADALQRRGAGLDPELVADGAFTISGGADAARRLLGAAEPPTAVFAMSDEMAFGVLTELQRRHLRPGGDVSIVGVDDHEVSDVVGLTTIRQLVPEQGAAAARSLLDVAEGRSVDVEAVISPVELIVRATTGPPPAG